MYRFRYKTFVFAVICGLVVAKNDDPKFHGDPDSLVFPGPIARSNGKSRPGVPPELPSDNQLTKSLELASRLNSITSVDEFLKLVHGVPETEFSITGRMGEAGERSNAEKPTAATCMPELQTVPLKQDDDPSTFYFPSCTRVKRCGGCCNHSLFSCQPTAVDTRNFEVVVTAIEPIGLAYKGKRIVPLEEHTKCECGCKIKEEHCNEKQLYIPEECRCMCNNVDEEEKCYKNSETKIWNPEHCACFCREAQECSTGFYFDQNTCRCRQVPLSMNWFPATKGADYGFGQTQRTDNVPPVIIALDATDPRRKPKKDPEYK
ncbi:PDGF- and VEGF-related factor 1 [Megachile rotundata]|uniref:PDGF- and VEGF-related factor 1 n=1 Tax=Megachile rotundata TaxID=143995 RepID=UPI000258E322|nr:PREDICTED: vascular endothelial growth factor C [Megachile rotundata]